MNYKNNIKHSSRERIMKKTITIVAFQDNQTNSVAYKKFEDENKAIEFYAKQLKKDNVRVISTRKVYEK